MRYIVRPRHDHGNGSFSVGAADAKEALDFARGLIARGVPDVEILNEDRQPCDIADLERGDQDENPA